MTEGVVCEPPATGPYTFGAVSPPTTRTWASGSPSSSAATICAPVSVPVPMFDRNRGEIQRTTNEAIATGKELVWAERRIEAEVQGAYDAAQQLRVLPRHGSAGERALLMLRGFGLNRSR